MNRFKRPLFICIILLLMMAYVLPVMWAKANGWIQRYQTGRRSAVVGDMTSSLVFPVKPDHWITFNIPEGTRQLRIISNAHITQPDQILAEDNLKYILHYQLIDSNGEVLTDQRYYHRSKLSRYLDEQGQQTYGNYYVGYSLIPLDGRLMMLSMPTVQNAAALRISFIQQSPEVEEVAVRLYMPEKKSDDRLAAMWLRMSAKHKQVLARNTAYPAALLTEYEKRNLLKNQWHAQGPSGIHGQDYQPRTLYVLRELELEKTIEQSIASGLQVDLNHPGIIPIPEQGGELRIKLTRMDGSPLQEPRNVQLNWYGRTRDQRWSRQIQLLPNDEGSESQIEGGMLEVIVEQAALVHAELTTENQQQLDITPNPLIITAYQAYQGVEYDLVHVDQTNIPLRVDVRRLFLAETKQGSEAIEYQWLDSDNQLLNQGVLAVPQTPSSFDRLTGKQNHLQVSDPLSYFLNIPASVKRVRFVSLANDVLVNVYNQPAQFRKIQRIPESAFVSLDKKNWFPGWFKLQAVNHQGLLKQQAVSKIAGQYRPPVDNTDHNPHQYLWEDFQPLQMTDARLILTPINKSDYRDQALASVYCQLQANREQHLDVQAYGAVALIKPQLIYHRQLASPFLVGLEFNNRLIFQSEAIAQQGVFKLSDVPTGKIKIRLNTNDDGQFYINHVRACNANKLLKRRVFKLSDRELTFEFTNDKRQDRVFSARYFTSQGNQRRSLIDVSIEPLRDRPSIDVQDSWTFTRRLYDIRPPHSQPSIVLFSHNHILNSGENFFIAFKHDLPKGRYRIHFKLEQGESGFLSLSYITPGVFEQLRFYRETNDQAH